MTTEIYGPALLPEEYPTNPPASTGPIANSGRHANRGPTGTTLEEQIAKAKAAGDTVLLAKLAKLGLL